MHQLPLFIQCNRYTASRLKLKPDQPPDSGSDTFCWGTEFSAWFGIKAGGRMCVLHSGHRCKKKPSEVFVKNTTTGGTVKLLLKSRVYRTGMFLVHKYVTVWMGNAQGTRWEKRLSINMSKTRRKYGLTWRSLRYSIENCILKGNNINAYFNTSPRKGGIWLWNPCSELVSDFTNPVVVKHQENFPRKELHASNSAIAGAEAGVNTPDTGAWGCRGTSRAGQSVLGREQAGSHPRRCPPSRKGAQAQLVGWHLVTTGGCEVSQVSAEKFKGEQFYNLKETGNICNDTNIKMRQVAVRIYSQRIQQGSPEHSPPLMYSTAWCITTAP